MHPAFSDKIIKWYNLNKRDLPWRNTKNPYLIWLSEIILQQTRIEQGMPYYLKFAASFPTVKKMATANNEQIMKLWQGLGYYSRARNMHATAQFITTTYKGTFPENYEAILSLKGVGEYTAAAIASFAYDLPYAVVDGNVYRVLARVFGISTPIDSSEGKKRFYILANELINKSNPATHNQAIMEFGALQCKPVNPNCDVCILNSMCFAYSKKCVTELPVKEKKTKVRNRYFNYLVLKHLNKIAIHKRSGKDIWTGLYDFPLIETTKEITEEALLKSAEFKKIVGKNSFTIKSISGIFKHILSHQKLYARFIEIELAVSFNKIIQDTSLIINLNSLPKYAVPKLIETYLKTKGHIEK
ncbi:MAG: A/G-specific adenine glycosylase [Bacteroidia bacterium]